MIAINWRRIRRDLWGYTRVIGGAESLTAGRTGR